MSLLWENLLVYLPHFAADVVLFIDCKHVRDFPSVEEVTNVLQKVLLLNLCVSKEEDGRIAFCSFAENLLQILSPLNGSVPLAKLNLKSKVKVHDEMTVF